MPTGSPAISLLSVISLISFFIVLLTIKFSNKIRSGALLDQDFDKPQAFHAEPIARCGGLAGLISLSFFYILYYLLFDKILFAYLTLSFAFFLLGFLEDLQFKISPNYRLFFMIAGLLFFITFFSIKIGTVDLNFLDIWMSNNIFSIFFVLLCFLFIVNGANLIDGFNGLLTIHLLIINSILLFMSLENIDQSLTMVIAAQVVILLPILLFNFPKAKMFLGDGGSYLFGALVALNIIETNNSNPQISSFFFCILLFYLFFEVFFSFFRKLVLKKSPLKPDRLHLHMLIYGFLKKSQKFKDCNYLNSLIINSVYVALILPAIFFNDNGLICRYWFFSLLIIYLIFYYLFYSFEKNQ